MDGGAWWATVTKSQTQLSDFTHSLTHSPQEDLGHMPCLPGLLPPEHLLVSIPKLI